MSFMQVFEWFHCLKGGYMSADSDYHCWCSSLSRNDDVIANVCDLVRQNWSFNIREAAWNWEFLLVHARQFWLKISVPDISTKPVPWLLRAQQKKHCVSVISNLLDCAEAGENFMKSILNGGETLMYGYDSEPKQHLSQRPKKACQVWCKTKVISFWPWRYCAGGIHSARWNCKPAFLFRSIKTPPWYSLP